MVQLRTFSTNYGIPQNVAVERAIDMIASIDDPLAVLAILALPGDMDQSVIDHVVESFRRCMERRSGRTQE
ncbi:MAG: hypothetical protein IPK85_03405 [Gemmatimonadetes bacterium]|nr:hypothetical protein [Gemmatimonadota bacterium]